MTEPTGTDPRWLTHSKPSKAPRRDQHLPHVPIPPVHRGWGALYLSPDHNRPRHKGFGRVAPDAWKSKAETTEAKMGREPSTPAQPQSPTRHLPKPCWAKLGCKVLGKLLQTATNQSCNDLPPPGKGQGDEADTWEQGTLLTPPGSGVLGHQLEGIYTGMLAARGWQGAPRGYQALPGSTYGCRG